MKKVMFWSKNLNPNDLQDSIREEKSKKLVIDYFKKRTNRIAAYKGHAHCRICKKQLGSKTYIDKKLGFSWPERAEHYIIEHGVWYDDLDELCDKLILVDKNEMV